jgi:hypothetical protein
MKKLFLVSLIFIITGCKSSQIVENNLDNTILYVFHPNIENNLISHIKSLNNKDVHFDLKKNGDNYIIYVSNNNAVFNKSKTNRKAFIGGMLIPIIFNMDAVFATAENAGDAYKRLKNRTDDTILRKIYYPNYEGLYSIKFNLKGEIISFGNRSNW